MDELISQIRNTETKERDEASSLENDSDHPMDDTASKDLSDEDPHNPFNQEEVEKTLDEDEEDIHELTSSQVSTPLHIMKLDFNVLKQIRREIQAKMDIDEIKKSKKYKVEGEFTGIIKKLDMFGGDVACLELVDESDSIYGSCSQRVVDEFGLKVGAIIVLSNCSLWKINGNHLNIVSENIRKAV
ncbi:uncharacterized protein Eint_061330 [Encephalitozoon intestinalis ATCC 50506]|uniref:Uncharacterized protein n=1 Tax=Encephalitozoon intestinalis (strain ATCC 50506) TaxID=876142 RepID=E0S7Q9_ENCIT|nr:uncharacterized protein Eint_061330 [Encephalitozoon intestinalis ATCC 50506]ADM11738.1 hypothetical protein Eint_061330 [Encephalitozoon intestinalis ATCC 50506]UTX45477.1 hypothetical protein GPK93_06g10340 [Encephalitozoon intestinalis]